MKEPHQHSQNERILMKYKVVFFAMVLLLFIAGVFVFRIRNNVPPESEVTRARAILSDAQNEKSPKYANRVFAEAQQYYDSAMAEWKIQNEKFILFRDYQKVSEFAKESIERSEESIFLARKSITSIEEILEIRIGKVNSKIKHFEDNFGNFPMSKKHRDDFVKCKLIYSESVLAFKSRNYSSCTAQLDTVELVINDVTSHYQEKLTDYFKDYPTWKKWADQTILSSKKSQNIAIIVDKFSRKLLVLKNGKAFKTYSVELGVNWIGDKMQKGDRSTPEGVYKIVDKKHNGATRYYKAFLLDYPNEEDKKRFALNKSKGIIRHDAKIGNLIEIHGNGGKGLDWTDGCIALTDQVMDEVYRLCPVGTKVTIVGSTKSLNELSIRFN